MLISSEILVIFITTIMKLKEFKLAILLDDMHGEMEITRNILILSIKSP